MALPSRPQTFAYENCREFLMKLEREIDRYYEVAGSHEDHPKVLDVVNTLKDAAFNASVTAWHLVDWVFHDMKPEQRKQFGLTHKRDLQEYARKECPQLRLCELACVASKHWVVSDKNIKDDDVHTLVTGEPGWVVYFVEKDKKIAAEVIFGEAHAFWNQFIRQNDIAPGDLVDDESAAPGTAPD